MSSDDAPTGDQSPKPVVPQDAKLTFDEASRAVDDHRDSAQEHEHQLSELKDIPVKVTAILGSTRIRVSDLAQLSSGQIVELDRKVGEHLDVYVNNRLVARGEVVISDGQLGISLTEIIKAKD